jgi:hypothetical protein
MSDAPPATAQDMRDALDAIDAKITDARKVKNKSTGAAAVKMTDCLAQLRQARTALYEQVYLEAITDPAFVAAVDKLTAAAKHLDDVASNMTSATAFITGIAGFLGAVGGVMPVLKAHIG